MKEYIKLLGKILLAASITAQSAKAQFLDLEKKLAIDEANHEDLVIGTEKTIRWATGEMRKTPYAIVYLHGFSASRQELSPTTEQLADKIGANVFYTRLTGHGRSDEAMTEGRVAAWKKDAHEAFNIGLTIGEQVILISTSTGGTLAIWLQTLELGSQLAANIMISPNFSVNSSAAKILTWPGGLTVGKWINGKYRSFTPYNEKHALYWTERYPLEAVIPMLNLVEEVEDIDKSGFTAPQLIVYSPNDKIISVEKIEETIFEFKSVTVSLYRFTHSEDPAQHVLSGDACSPKSTKIMVDLMASYIENDFVLR